MSSQQAQDNPLNSSFQPIQYGFHCTVDENAEERWVKQVLEHFIDVPANEMDMCIFTLPKTLVATKPEAYFPQRIALGPYHHWRPELYDTERSKISAAKRTEKLLKNLNFEELVERFTDFHHKICSCYHRYLGIGSKTLACMMAIDASFLLEFLQVLADEDDKVINAMPSREPHLMKKSSSAKDIIVRDIMMLENQIPLFLLLEILRFQCHDHDPQQEFSRILTKFCEVVSPFENVKEFLTIQFSERLHLLELLYHALVLEIEGIPKLDYERAFEEQNPFPTLAGKMDRYLQNFNDGPAGFLLKPLTVAVRLPWSDICKYWPFSYCKSCFSTDDANSMEEIDIPSVSDLVHAGVTFEKTDGGISTVKFDPKKATFHLPTFILDINTQVVLRNLVAYEAATAPDHMYFTRYADLMYGIVDTEEDVKIQREKGIISSPSMNDGELASAWNGMRKSERSEEATFIDPAITAVNDYYNNLWKVKMKKAMKSYVIESWQVLTFIAVIVLLLLTCLEAFCSVYACNRWFGGIKVSE